MTDGEIREWLAFLPKVNAAGNFERCVGVEEQRIVVRNLLKNAGRDHMSPQDRLDCARGLELLTT